MARRFSPWVRDNFARSAVFALTGLAGLYAGIAGHINWALAAGAGLVLLLLAYGQFRRGRARQFGKHFESRCLRDAEAVLGESGFRFQMGRLVRGIGDIDLVVTNLSGRRVTVEIKSFVYWRQFGPFMGERERKALHQAAAQREAIDADRAVVWLPQGRATLFQLLVGWIGNRDVTVVFGGPRKLAHWIGRLG